MYQVPIYLSSKIVSLFHYLFVLGLNILDERVGKQMLVGVFFRL